jgi:hypothetical protein
MKKVMLPTTMGFTIVSQSLTIATMTAALWLLAPDILQDWFYWLAISAYVVLSELTQEVRWHWGRLKRHRLF